MVLWEEGAAGPGPGVGVTVPGGPENLGSHQTRFPPEDQARLHPVGKEVEEGAVGRRPSGSVPPSLWREPHLPDPLHRSLRC